MDSDSTPTVPQPKCHTWQLWLLLAVSAVLLALYWLLQVFPAVIMASESPYIMKQILLALYMYADENEGHFPPESGIVGLRRSVQVGGLDPSGLTCSRRYPAAADPASIREENTSYYYLGGYGPESPRNTMILIEKPFPYRKVTRVGCADGRVTTLEDLTAP